MLGLKFLMLQCPFCGRRFRLPVGDNFDEFESKMAIDGLCCKFCSKHFVLEFENVYLTDSELRHRYIRG
jgi:hypothetical protein